MPRLRLSRSELIGVALTAAAALALGALVLALRTPRFPLRVAYLPARDVPAVWAVTPGDPDSALPLTVSGGQIEDYAPSPDGRWLVVAERDRESTRIVLKLVDLVTGSAAPLSDCAAAGADCTSPVWRPDGSAIAYVRTQYDEASGTMQPHVWMIEGPTTDSPEAYRMFDARTFGIQPAWSGDGQRLAMYDVQGHGVLVFDFEPEDESAHFAFVPADNGMTGALSPDGETLITTMIRTIGEEGFRSQLVAADLSEQETRLIVPDDFATDGTAATWHPDGRRVAVLRQSLGGENAAQGQQVYLYDLADDTLTPLIVDGRYNHGSLSFSPDGRFLLVQRYSFELIRPEIWVYDMETGELAPVAINAYLPAWVPSAE